MIEIFCVGAGGFIGAALRYLLGTIPLECDFPFVTLAINFVGAIVIGAVAEAAGMQNSRLPGPAVLFLKTGLCGGFTTFSTFSLETLTLLEQGKIALGGAYAAISVVLCIAGVIVGKAIVRWAAGAVAA